MGSDVNDRILRAVAAEVPIYFHADIARGIPKDCETNRLIKSMARIDLAKRIEANLAVIGEIPGSLLDMYEKKHNIVPQL